MKTRRAFTVLQTIAAFFMIGMLVSIIIFVVNPQRQLAETRNSKRVADAGTILTAINEYVIDHNSAPAGMDDTLRVIGTANVGCNLNCWTGVGTSSCLNLAPILTPKYLLDIPMDPILGTAERTYFAVRKKANDRIVVYSCGAELGENLTITR